MNGKHAKGPKMSPLHAVVWLHARKECRTTCVTVTLRVDDKNSPTGSEFVEQVQLATKWHKQPDAGSASATSSTTSILTPRMIAIGVDPFAIRKTGSERHGKKKSTSEGQASASPDQQSVFFTEMRRLEAKYVTDAFMLQRKNK